MGGPEVPHDAGLRATTMPVLVIGGALLVRVFDYHVLGPHRDALATAGTSIELLRDRCRQDDRAAVEIERAKAVPSVRQGEILVHPAIFPRIARGTGEARYEAEERPE